MEQNDDAVDDAAEIAGYVAGDVDIDFDELDDRDGMESENPVQLSGERVLPKSLRFDFCFLLSSRCCYFWSQYTPWIHVHVYAHAHAHARDVVVSSSTSL